MPEADALAGAGAVEAVRDGDEQPAATLDTRASESAEALFIMTND